MRALSRGVGPVAVRVSAHVRLEGGAFRFAEKRAVQEARELLVVESGQVSALEEGAGRGWRAGR